MFETVELEVAAGDGITGVSQPQGDAWHVTLRRPESGDVDADRVADVLAHEAAHAWILAEPGFLREALVEGLATCAVNRTGRRPQGTPLDAIRDPSPDLTSWGTVSDERTFDADLQRRYAMSAHWGRALALAIGPHALIDLATPEDVRTALAGVAHGEAILAARTAPADWLVDADRDGLSRLEELVLGTDPTRWDTDGDGWWDGALPRSGTPVKPGSTAFCGPFGEGGRVRATGSASNPETRTWTPMTPGDRALSLPRTGVGGGLVVHAEDDRGAVPCRPSGGPPK